MPRKKELIPKAEFEAMLPLMKNISIERQVAAYQYLVNDRSGALIAKEYGWTRAAVWEAAKAVKGFWDSYRECKRIEQGWDSELVNEFRIALGN